MSYALFLDDVRSPEDVTWVELPKNVSWTIVRDFWEFKSCIANCGIPDMVSFDHDLGTPRHTGKDCADFLAMICMRECRKFPEYWVHSQNPVGAKAILGSIADVEKYRESFSD